MTSLLKQETIFEQFSGFLFQCAIQQPSTSSDLQLHQSADFAWPWLTCSEFALTFMTSLLKQKTIFE